MRTAAYFLRQGSCKTPLGHAWETLWRQRFGYRWSMSSIGLVPAQATTHAERGELKPCPQWLPPENASVTAILDLERFINDGKQLSTRPGKEET